MNNKVITFLTLCLSSNLLICQKQNRGILAHVPKPSLKKTTKAASLPAPEKKVQPVSSIKIPTMPAPPPIVQPPAKEASKPTQPLEEPKYKEPQKAAIKTPEEQAIHAVSKQVEEKEQKFRFYFEDATLENVVKYFETLFKITFLADDAVAPVMQGGGGVGGHKITFKTNRPLSRQDSWDVFVRLLDLAGLALVPGPTRDFYRITSTTNANKEALPTFFDTNIDQLPDNPTKVRYIYFVKNNPLITIANMAKALASTTAIINTFTDLDALIVTDKATNIRSLMQIVQEFDKDTPEAMSILKLRRTDAATVAALYDNLTKEEGARGRYMHQRKQPASLYFPANARIIAEPRTNSLILLGTKQALEKIENFIVKHIDTELDMPYSPLHVYDLQNTDAAAIKAILEKVTKFDGGAQATKYGGVRDGHKFFQSVQITEEKAGNRLIIKAEEDDYKHLKAIIDQLDIDQPQVAIEVLIVDVSSINTKNLGVQLRNTSNGSILKNVNMQSSGVSSIVPDTASGSLLGNLIGLATGESNPIGTSLLSVGSAATNGIWGLVRVLKTFTTTKIIENPFLLSTNNWKAFLSFGETRQIQTATVGEKKSYEYLPATFSLEIIPQINTEGVITLAIDINIKNFLGSSANTTTKHINTFALAKDQEVIALGGITKNKVTRTTTKVPLLGDIPLLGNLFRSKSKVHTRSNVIVFISPKIIYPMRSHHHMHHYTHHKAEEIRDNIGRMEQTSLNRDPINNMFFRSEGTNEDSFTKGLDQFMDPDINKEDESSEKTDQTLQNLQKRKNGKVSPLRKRRLARKRRIA